MPIFLSAAAGSEESRKLAGLLFAALLAATKKLRAPLLGRDVMILDAPRLLVQARGGSMSKMRFAGLPVLLELGQLLNMRLLKAQALIHGARCRLDALSGVN